MMPFVAGRLDIPTVIPGRSGTHCKDVPISSQRHQYDFIKQPDRHLWWYLACFAEGGCCAGPQRKCTKEDRVALQGTCSVPCFMGWPNYSEHTRPPQYDLSTGNSAQRDCLCITHG